VDVVDPGNPVEVAAYEGPDWAEGVAVLGREVYLADSEDGLLVFHHTRFGPNVVTVRGLTAAPPTSRWLGLVGVMMAGLLVWKMVEIGRSWGNGWR
jgi:hypothetical protein